MYLENEALYEKTLQRYFFISYPKEADTKFSCNSEQV